MSIQNNIKNKKVHSKRDRIRMLRDVLRVCLGNGLIPTHIMQKANLNHDYLKMILPNLQAQGLLAEERGVYITSSQGIEFMLQFDELHRKIGQAPPLMEVYLNESV